MIELDISHAFGAIDYANAGGLTTYIDIGLNEALLEHFNFTLFNIVLNRLDDPVIDSLAQQAPDWVPPADDDSFLIVQKAEVHFEQVKGYESSLTVDIEGHRHSIDKAWGQPPAPGDRIYDIGGRLSVGPGLTLNLAVICNATVSLRFAREDCVYVEDYPAFLTHMHELNSAMSTRQHALAGPLFDIDFRNRHLNSDWERGYSLYSGPATPEHVS